MGVGARLAGIIGAGLLGVATCGVAGAEPRMPTTVAPPPAPPPLPFWPPPGPALMLAPAEPVSLNIPALGVRSEEIVPLGLQADGTMEVPDSAHAAGRYAGAPMPGALGPAVLVAHVDWKGERGLFHNLGALRPGDTVEVARADGSRAVFRVTRVERHPKDGFPTHAVYGSPDHAELRLITCGGDFDTERASFLDNVVVFATLVHAEV